VDTSSFTDYQNYLTNPSLTARLLKSRSFVSHETAITIIDPITTAVIEKGRLEFHVQMSADKIISAQTTPRSMQLVVDHIRNYDNIQSTKPDSQTFPLCWTFVGSLSANDSLKDQLYSIWNAHACDVKESRPVMVCFVRDEKHGCTMDIIHEHIASFTDIPAKTLRIVCVEVVNNSDCCHSLALLGACKMLSKLLKSNTFVYTNTYNCTAFTIDMPRITIRPITIRECLLGMHQAITTIKQTLVTTATNDLKKMGGDQLRELCKFDAVVFDERTNLVKMQQSLITDIPNVRASLTQPQNNLAAHLMLRAHTNITQGARALSYAAFSPCAKSTPLTQLVANAPELIISSQTINPDLFWIQNDITYAFDFNQLNKMLQSSNALTPTMSFHQQLETVIQTYGDFIGHHYLTIYYPIYLVGKTKDVVRQQSSTTTTTTSTTSKRMTVETSPPSLTKSESAEPTIKHPKS
jgi:hypothetical protein